jgi:hypothetical protein
VFGNRSRTRLTLSAMTCVTRAREIPSRRAISSNTRGSASPFPMKRRGVLAVLDDFLRSNRQTIITRARARVASRANPIPTDAELTNGDDRVRAHQERSGCLGGSTGGVLDRSMVGLRDLIDRSLADVRLDAGIERPERISVAEFIEGGRDRCLDARGVPWSALHCDARGPGSDHRGRPPNPRRDRFEPAPERIQVQSQSGTVTRTNEATANRVLFHVEDECGGLPPGKVEELFRGGAVPSF